jgi:hypothetical protein
MFRDASCWGEQFFLTLHHSEHVKPGSWIDIFEVAGSMIGHYTKHNLHNLHHT